MTTVCRGCGKPIKWVRTHGGQKMPVDIESVQFVADRSGTETFVRTDGSVTVGRRAGPQDYQAEPGYISHFATCPQADAFRKREKAEKKTAMQQQMTMQI